MNEDRTRTLLAVGAVVLALLAVGSGAIIALSSGGEEAAERGDEVVNDYYVVNDNARLRTLPLADEVVVRYIPADGCCDLQDGDIDAWLESILGTNPTDYPGKDAAWWFVVDGGRITRIEQQFLP